MQTKTGTQYMCYTKHCDTLNTILFGISMVNSKEHELAKVLLCPPQQHHKDAATEAVT